MSDKELQRAFVQAQLDVGTGFDEAWDAWKYFRAKLRFIATQPCLPRYSKRSEDPLKRDDRTRMRRDPPVDS